MKLEPLTIEDIMSNSENREALQRIDASTLEYKETKTQYGMITGLFRKNTDIIEGIAR